MSTTAIITEAASSISGLLSRVILVGDGALADALVHDLRPDDAIVLRHYHSLADLCDAPADVAESAQPALLVAASAHWRPAHDRALHQWCWERGVPFLRVSVWQREAVIGPLAQPGQPGCLECAERRRFRAFTESTPSEIQFLRWCEDDAHIADRPPNPWATPVALRVVSALAAEEIRQFIGARSVAAGTYALPAHEHAVRFVQLLSLTSERHTFLPDSLCPVCAAPPDDRREDAIPRLEPRLRARPGQYRLRSLAHEVEHLESLYADTRIGVVPTPKNLLIAEMFAVSTTDSIEYPYIYYAITCGGYTHEFRASRAAAIAEALERYSGHFPRARRTTVHGSYRQLREHAVDPASFGLYSAEQYARHSDPADQYHYVAYSPDLEFSWVWGYSMRERRPILVPEQIAYYSTKYLRPEEPAFICETSNGCALGSSFEEATLYGLTEALERDAFMLTWYGRLPLPAIDIQSTRDATLRLAVERVERMTGFDYYAFDCTTDFGVPIVLVLGVNRADTAPRMLCATGAHLDPDQALANAFYEVAAMVPGQKVRMRSQVERGERMVADSSLVQTIEDHILVGGMPSAFDRVSFLLRGQLAEPLSARFAAHYARPPHQDLTQDLSDMVERVISCGYDVVVVDQTAPELGASDLYCARVLVPGLLPMTFNHEFQRAQSLERVYRMPQELGYADHILTPDELNPYPHPFP